MAKHSSGRWLVVAAAVTAALMLPPTGSAVGGVYIFAGGTPAERNVVATALKVSSFNWSLVSSRITIHIVRGVDSYATPGEIWLDADLLDAGTFAMGVVQHEYAHQVDFFLFDDFVHAQLLTELGAADWC